MKTHLSKRILALLLTLIMVLSLMPTVFAEEPAQDLTGKTVILHTNDTHGALMGFAQVAQVRKDYEARGARVLLVDAGDFSQGTTYVSTNKGAAAVQMMEKAGYDLVTLGNHEFDFGYEQLKNNLGDAGFMTVCADVFLKGTNETVWAPYTMFNLSDDSHDWLRIGFFGMETPETQTKVNPGLITEIEFGTNENGKFLSSAQNAINTLKEDGADLIIGLVHLGVDAESEPYRSTDLYAELQEDVDFLIDGHSHTVMTEGPNGEPIQSTGTKASATALMNVGCIVIDNATKTIEDHYLIPLGADAPVDETVAAAAQEIMDAVDAEYGAVFATSEVELNGDKAPGNRNMETNLGDLITDSMRWGVMKDMDAETLGVPEENVVAITNGGGIRAWIHAGDVTMNDVNTVLPFGNTIAVVYVTGAELLEALEASTYSTPGAVGGFPQVSGIQFNINTDEPFDEGELYPESTYHKPASIRRVTIDNINGKPFDEQGLYAVVTNNFCAAGGDTYYAFKSAVSQFDTGIPLDEMLMEYIKEELNGVIGQEYAEIQGRITQGPLELSGKTVILHTNDIHGALMGYAQVAAVKTEYERLGAKVILVDAGDYSQGTTYVSTNKGAAAITMMNAAGYDYATLGNHEFDFGYAQLMQNMQTAVFKPLVADVLLKETGKSIFDGHALVDVNGLKIGLFGMETPETFTKVNPGLITEITFPMGEEMYACAQAEVDALKEEGADLIIGLVHLGVDPESEPNRSTDLYAQVSDIDFLIDGHSHTVMTEGPNGEPIQSTGTKASTTSLMNVGLIQIDNATKAIEKHELIPISEDSPKDESVAALAQQIMDAVDAEYGAVFAQSAVELNGDRAPGNRNEETNLGDLITDSMRWGVLKDMDAETLGVAEENVVAITNGGGIRAWIHAGDVTRNDINTVLPFGNTVAVVYVTGAELLEALEASTYCTPTAVGGFPQISGMNITINTTKEFDEGEFYPESTYHKPASIRRVSIQDVNGKPFDPEATYAVITNNFCAAGGDTYYAFKAASRQFDTGIPMDEMLMDFILDPSFMNGYISDHYAEPQGRITIKGYFEDVADPGMWFFKPVYWAVNHEPYAITKGTDATHFSPDQQCTRAQIVTFLYAAADRPDVSGQSISFSDVSEGSWYYNAVTWAVNHDPAITKGTDATHFNPDGLCTRAQVVTFLWAAAGKPEPVSTENPFTDVPDDSWYVKAVLWAVENGITKGTGEGLFSPDKICTRAEVVTFLYAFLAKETTATVKVFETTDIHGYLLDASSLDEETFQYRMAYLANIFNEARESGEYDDVLLLDGGDIYQGTPVSNLLQGNAIRAALDLMDYDAVALGNHEFDWGVTNNADEEGTIPAYEIGGFSGDPDIPILAYNLYDAETGEPVNFTQDYIVVEKGGFRIAIVGYIPNYRNDIMAARINPYTIDEDLTKLAAKVKEINEAEKPDVTVVLAHESPKGIANAMDPAEVQLVVGGHSHSATYGTASNGVAYIQGNCQAKGYASALITFTRIGAGETTVTVTDPAYTNTTGRETVPYLYDTEENADKLDPEILALSHAAWEEVKDDMEEVLGYVDVDVDKTKVSDNGATVAGNWISGLMLRGTANLHPVAAFYNSGGIRTTFKIPEGETTRNITTADIYTINPFDNCWLVFELTGAEIAQQLLNGFVNGNFGDQMSGLTFTYWQEGSGKNAVRGIVSITLDDGTEIDPTDTETTYRVCTSNYSATLDDSVFLGKEPLVPMADAPIDNVTIIELLRAEGQANNGYLAVDTGVRGTRVEKPEVQEPVEFEFLVTSDLHGQIFATDYTQPYANSGTYSRGLTRVATYIKEQREAFGDNLYVVDMGDTFQGAPLTYYYAFNKPEEKDPAILAFRSIGYDMWVVGNHEFNYGLEILTRQMDYAVSEGDENEKQLTISMANYLKAETNNDETKDWATWRDVAPYVIKDFDGYKVAVIGFGNPNIPQWDVPANWEGIYFANIIETYKHYEAEMLEQADMIVVVAHSGVDSDPNSDFIRELVAETNTIAFAFSGHEHRNAITKVQNADGKEISILSPYTKARRIAQVKVTVDGEEITLEPELKNMENYPLDEELVALLQPYETDTWENYMLQPIGMALGDYPAANLGTAPSAFVDLINTVQIWGGYDRGGVNTPDKTEDDTPAMLSITAPLTVGNNTNLISEGEIYLGDMFGLYRFENWFYQITMNGEEIHQWLEFAATKIRLDGEGNPYVTSGDLTYYDIICGDGFRYDIDVSRPAGERVVNMTYNGAKVQADQVFTVMVNNYRYNGGGNYVSWLNEHGCEFVANDPDRIIYSTQFDMIQGEDEGQARALLVSYIKEQTALNGGITPIITSTWTVQNGIETPDGVVETTFPSTDNADIEKYGNIFTALDAAAFFQEGFTWGDLVTVEFLDQSLELPIVPTYSYVDQGSAAVIVGKDGETGEPTGRVKMAINMGDFATTYGLATKTTNADKTYFWTANEGVEFPVPVTVTMKEAGGYMAELLLHDINRTNNREDYPELTDEEFANFRQITTTGMGDHLYRGSSPINPEIGRNSYADAALKNAGVTVIMNLANDQAAAEAYPGFADTYYSQQNVIYLNLGVDFQAADFQAGLANGLKFFAENQGVYYVHCTEGKDRAGFVSALLECFMGASYDEVVADYLKTYTNYYTVVDGVQQPLSQETLDAIANSNIIKTLQTAFDVSDLVTADLAAEAEEYIAAIGLSAQEIENLKANLGGSLNPVVETTFPSATKADIDKYGDVHFSISSADLAAAGFEYKDLVKLSFLDQELIVPIIPQYRYVGAKAVGLVMWEDGTKPAEVEVFNGSFAATYGLADVVREGSDYTVTPKEGVEFPVDVTIEMYEKQGYADTYAIFDLTRSNDREDYRGNTEPYPELTDEEFANFRMITTTGMGDGVLYRASSPINPSIGRNSYADAAAEAAGVKSFVNLADSAASAAKYAGYAESYYSNQNICFLNLGVDFTTELNREGLKTAMEFIAAEESEAPFLVHCNEGQDRAGFVSGLLECLMGAGADEVIADYMVTFYNYYGVQKDTDQYAQISNNIVKNLSTAFGIETSAFATADLAQEAAEYLQELGVSEQTVAAVKAKLGAAATPTESYYVKVTASEDLTEGKYLIVYEVDAVAMDGSRTDKLDAGNNVREITIGENGIAAEDVDFYFTYDGEGTFTSASGLNLGHSQAKNGLDGIGTNTVSIDTDGNAVIQGTGGYYLRFNKASGETNYRFRYYGEGKQQPIALYKLNEG